MKFLTKVTNQEKKAMYERAIAGLEKALISQLVHEGIVPEEFDEDNFVPQPFFGREEIDPSQMRIADTVEKIKRIRTLYDALD